MLGGLDSFVYGAIMGLAVSTTDAEATHLSRKGIKRYLLIFMLIHGILAVSYLINESGKIGDMFSGIVVLLLIGLLRTVVRRWNRVPA